MSSPDTPMGVQALTKQWEARNEQSSTNDANASPKKKCRDLEQEVADLKAEVEGKWLAARDLDRAIHRADVELGLLRDKYRGIERRLDQAKNQHLSAGAYNNEVQYRLVLYGYMVIGCAGHRALFPFHATRQQQPELRH